MVGFGFRLWETFNAWHTFTDGGWPYAATFSFSSEGKLAMPWLLMHPALDLELLVQQLLLAVVMVLQ